MTDNSFKGGVEALEPRQMFTAGPAPTASFMQYVRGNADARTFAIFYDSPQGQISRGTLGGDDVRVFGSNDFSAAATFAGVARAKANSHGALAQYRIGGLAPGVYRIEVRDGAVADTSERYVTGSVVGGFRVFASGRAAPLPPPPSNPTPGPILQVLPTLSGPISVPPPIDSNFGSVIAALNFGGPTVTVPSIGQGAVTFYGRSATSSASPLLLQSAPITVQMLSENGNDLYDATVGGNSLYETEIFTASQGTQSILITGLDPQASYRVQILHGDSRGYVYGPTIQTYTISDGQKAFVPLEFGANQNTVNTLTPVVVAGTTSLRIDMPNGGRGPSFSALMIEAGQVAPPLPPTPEPLPPINARFIRGSVRLVGSGQQFDVAYDDADASTNGLAGGVTVSGPRGFGALATLVSLTSRQGGSGLIATYRVEGVSVTGSYEVAVRGQRAANVTLFHLRPMFWDLDGGGGDTDVVTAGRRRLRRHR